MDIRFTRRGYCIRHDYSELLLSGTGYSVKECHFRISERVYVVSRRSYEDVQNQAIAEFRRQKRAWELYHDIAEDFIINEKGG